MQTIVFAKDPGGVPTTREIVDLSSRGAVPSFSHRALWGPYDATVTWAGDLEEGFDVADRWLGNPVEVWSTDGEWLWEGIVWSVTFGAGTRARTRSLDGYANRVRVLWHDVTGGQGTPVVADDADGQATYGVYEYVHNAGTVESATATALADQQLSLRSRLLYPPARGGSTGQIELDCAGRYRTLGNQTYTATTAGTDDVAVVIQAILAAAPMISTDYSQIETTGTVTLQAFDAYETPLEIIRRLLDETPDYVFGVGQGGIPYLRLSRRLNADADYVERSTGVITDAAGVELMPWLVQADRILRQQNFVPTSFPAAAIDAIENLWLSEVRYSAGSLDYSASIAGREGGLRAY